MHTAQDLFIAHVFHCEPSSGALCKTIEAACKVGAFVPSFVHPRPKSFQCMHLIIPRIGNLPMSLFLTIRLFIILNLQFLKILFKTRYFCGFWVILCVKFAVEVPEVSWCTPQRTGTGSGRSGQLDGQGPRRHSQVSGRLTYRTQGQRHLGILRWGLGFAGEMLQIIWRKYFFFTYIWNLEAFLSKISEKVEILKIKIWYFRQYYSYYNCLTSRSAKSSFYEEISNKINGIGNVLKF